MENMEENVGKMEAQLKQWGAKLDDLVDKVDEAGAEVKSDYRKRIVDLKAKHREAQATLDKAKSAGSEKWEAFKAGIESAWNELEIAFKKLTN